MSDVKQVKVDNWGIYFLQRLKHFFNRTDYCDLTLQFQDNAQLKVHRLVLSACTEYFELLERTCEMYEDCLVMPDDLQADVVVPIVNFMYTGQLEFKIDMLEKLYQTSLVMNMPVLSKLLEAHRPFKSVKGIVTKYNSHKKTVRTDIMKHPRLCTPPPNCTSSSSSKRSYSKAFQNNTSEKEKTSILPVSQPVTSPVSSYKSTARSVSPTPAPSQPGKKYFVDPRPTRYELPEELDTDNIFENSFCNISYTCKPLMVHPETTKHYPSKKSHLFNELSEQKKMLNKTSTMDIVEYKKLPKNDNIFENINEIVNDETELFQSSFINLRDEYPKDSNQLFDQILDTNGGPKVMIEAKDSKQVNNIDHAKIISEVLKKYPHLIKSNKNIKLKILNTPTKTKKHRSTSFVEEKDIKTKTETPDYTYETDVLDSKEAAKLIAMGAENIKGPWICLICGTPGRALHFTSYYKFRRHLVDVHNEKPLSTICEYCGFRSFKRNCMLYHCYMKHGVEPPPQYNFPKCNLCDYVAITEGVLIKHKMSTHFNHKSFVCNVCSSSFNTTTQLLAHIQKTGHKYTSDKKTKIQCIYCLKIFLYESNLYNHLKTNHKRAAKRDGIIEDSDDERQKINDVIKAESIKYEVPMNYDNESEELDIQYEIRQKHDGTHVISEKQRSSASPLKQKILNPGFSTPAKIQKTKAARNASIHNEQELVNTMPSVKSIDEENIVIIDDNEYIVKGNQLIPMKVKPREKEYAITQIMEPDINQSLEAITPSTSMQYTAIQHSDNMQQTKMVLKKSNISQPIQIVVSNEEEYKALMSSNHSIIFEDGDTNKTLTVMATPHNTTLDTGAIDLDSAQSNEMMILPEDYTLNVSEATDNSNIVVVYSHQVGNVDDDSNKQYQIITSQDVGAQYVQSSAIITQNFETVTTSTPVMSAHVIDTQIDDSWQNNDEQNIVNQPVHITSEAQLQPIVSTQLKGEADSLTELPEVQLVHETKDIPPQINEIRENLNQPNILNIQDTVQHNPDQVIDEEMQNISSSLMETNVPCETIVNKEGTASESIDNTNEKQIEVTPESHDIIPSNIQEQQVVEISTENQNDDSFRIEGNSEETNEPGTHETPVIEKIQLAADEHIPTTIIEPKDSHENEDVIAHEAADVIPNCDQEPTLSKEAKDQIQNLTSEWSEDEFETTTRDAANDNEDEKSIADNITVHTTADSPELEESIENIQQEMEKQMAGVNTYAEKSEDSLNTDSPATPKEPEEQTTDVTSTRVEMVPMQEKLSSLLNDWDDNDSQEEENNTTNVNEGNVTVTEVNVDTAKAKLNTTDVDVHAAEVSSTPPNEDPEAVTDESAVIIKLDSKKDDNIKSLVSDWDDDEEESKEDNQASI